MHCGLEFSKCVSGAAAVTSDRAILAIWTGLRRSSVFNVARCVRLSCLKSGVPRQRQADKMSRLEEEAKAQTPYAI